MKRYCASVDKPVLSPMTVIKEYDHLDLSRTTRFFTFFREGSRADVLTFS